MNASTDENEQIKTTAINSLIENQKKIEEVFNQLIKGYSFLNINSESNSLPLFEGIRDAFITD
ncbi:hypothetical protein, partial [Acinetobacter seifertii]